MGLRGAVRKADRGRVQSLERPCANQSPVRVQISTIASIEQFMTHFRVIHLYNEDKGSRVILFRQLYRNGLLYLLSSNYRTSIWKRYGRFLDDILSSFTTVYYAGKKYFKRTENEMKVAFCVSYNLQRCSYSFIEFPKLLHLVMTLDKATRNTMIRNLSVD